MHRTTIVVGVLVGCLFATGLFAAEEGNEETPHVQKLRVALQEKQGGLPTVAVNTQQEHVSFQTIDLTGTLTTVEGKRYYASQMQITETAAS